VPPNAACLLGAVESQVPKEDRQGAYMSPHNIRLFVVIGALAISGCVSNTGVQPIGNDTYTLSVGVSATGSVSRNDTSSKQKAIEQANQYCAKLGKQLTVERISLNSSMAGSTSELIFKCL
jgi:hypothetical protein